MNVALLVAALVCFALAAFGGYTARTGGGVWWGGSIGWFGLALITIDWLLPALH